MGRTIAWLFGGVCCAGGVLNLIYSFGPEYTKGSCMAPSCAGINTALDKAGWDSLADFALKDPASLAIPLIFLGIATLVTLNATAWKTTGGY